MKQTTFGKITCQVLSGVLVLFGLGGVVSAKPLPLDEKMLSRSQSGLAWQDVTTGSGKVAEPGHQVSVHYTGWLYPDGKKFDSSEDRFQPFDFKLGAHQVIEGWDQGVKGMKEGGKRILIIPAQMAYGSQGVPGAIPPNATLRFDVELLKVK